MERDGSLPCSPIPFLSQMNPIHTLPPHFFHIHSCIILPNSLGLMVSSLHVFQPKFYINFSSLPCELHVLPILILLDLIVRLENIWCMKRKSSEAPRAVFYSLPRLPSSWVQIVLSAPSSHRP